MLGSVGIQVLPKTWLLLIASHFAGYCISILLYEKNALKSFLTRLCKYIINKHWYTEEGNAQQHWWCHLVTLTSTRAYFASLLVWRLQKQELWANSGCYVSLLWRWLEQHVLVEAVNALHECVGSGQHHQPQAIYLKKWVIVHLADGENKILTCSTHACSL